VRIEGLTDAARQVLANLNNRGQLVTAEILREQRRPGSPLSHYFAPGQSRDEVANKLISIFLRSR
jgi:hypothetical protein